MVYSTYGGVGCDLAGEWRVANRARCPRRVVPVITRSAGSPQFSPLDGVVLLVQNWHGPLDSCRNGVISGGNYDFFHSSRKQSGRKRC